jgi:acetamidase/formamidase
MSGDEITIDTVTGAPETVPPKPFHTPPELFDIHQKNDRFAGAPHILDTPLKPFFGIMCVAPPKNWGRCTSVIPRSFGGNIDTKQLVAGTTLYLLVHVPGANFSCGDGHGAQGDGEVCLTAIETALQGRFRLTLGEDMSLKQPRAETSTHMITMGFDTSLDRAMETALREMIDYIVETRNISRMDAYTLCSVGVDFHVTQTVNTSKGVHGLLPKALFA